MTQRQLMLSGGRSIVYTLKVSARRRTIGLRIDAGGLTVHIPRRIPAQTVEGMLQDKSGWITRKLEEWQDKPRPMEWNDGVSLQFLGKPIQLCLRPDSRNRALEFDGIRLSVVTPTPEDAALVRRKVIQWFAKQAREDFSRRVEILSAKLGLAISALRLSNARTRWGSCNSRGEIRLNWRLIQAPPHIIQYVIAHELAHLKEMNHSPAFWAWVEKLCPDYLAARKALKESSAQLHIV